MPDLPARIAQLVETFDYNIEAYKTNAYNETQLRREFIDPFFQTLGWDVTNEQGWAPAYREVIHEDAIKVGGYTKAPDYCFRIGGVRKFFLEAKKPSIDIKGDPHPAYQLRRYAWSAKLPLSILTDFEEFAVYDCRIRPKQTDKAAAARVMYYNYKQYADHWHDIEGIFSKHAILKGSFDKYTASTKAKRGTGTVDKEFLAEIEKWRQMLARTIALKNRALTREQINFAVQRTIDRILFLRMCEDRGIETYGQLLALSSGSQTYPRLCRIFTKADDKYNSGLFYFRKEKDRATPPDEFTPNIVVDDTPLKWILHSLYYPQSPYEFSVLPAEILGNVYEQFLAQVIELTPGHRVKIESKPEVKRAGGVYYTPTYIVDYIVKNTVGKLLRDPTCHSRAGGNPPRHCEEQSDEAISKPLTPKQISKLKILDPACGSGSFLLGAYTYLLDYHRDWYLEHDPQKHRDKIYQGKGAQWFLTIAEKKRILLDNIFGVDIDSQAVEVTKLSLLLKVLEGESQDTVESQYKMFHERALPDLGNNIKCGNSLIGPDFYDNLPPEQITDDLRRRINAFDWKAEFPNIFAGKAPGFNAVIGNPPYVRIQGFPREEVRYFTKRYSSAVKNADIYVSFVELAYSILGSRGAFGFILPNKFFRTDYGEGLRNFLSSRRAVTQVVDFKANQVFSGTTYTCLLFLSRTPTEQTFYAESQASRAHLQQLSFVQIPTSSLGRVAWCFRTPQAESLVRKMRERSVRLLDLPAQMSRGSSTGADGIFIFEGDTLQLEPEILRTPLFATDFERYYFGLSHSKRIIFPYGAQTADYSLYSEADLRKMFPKTFRYLSANRQALEKRKQYRAWYGFSAPRNLELHDSASIAVPLLANQGSFALVPTSLHGMLCPMASGGFTIRLPADAPISARYLLGILNSKLLYWRLEQASNIFRGGWITCTKQYFGELPIRVPDFTNRQDKRLYDRVGGLVDRMLDLHTKLAAAKVPDEKTRIQRQIDTTDKKIDNLVYELYGLTDEEMKIVEESSK